MAPGNRLVSTALGLTLLLAACGGGGGGATANSVSSALQDLGVDPNGRATVVTFGATISGTLSPGNFEADGGQLALGVVVVDDEATVTWDERVTPADQVRVVGVAGVGDDFVAVTSSDPSAPAFAAPAGAQNPGLGNDVLTVTFSGPRVTPESAQDADNWALRTDGVDLDLTGSVFVLDEDTQVLTVTLGPLANVHASFELSAQALESVSGTAVASAFVGGTATGDTDPPSLVSAVQNVDEDEFGYTVDFTFDEAMDPVFATQLAHFDAGFPVLATSVSSPGAAILRVTFTEPRVPGVDSVDLLAGLVDVHGNAVDNGGVTAVAQGTPVANDWASVDLRTVADAGGDHLEVVFDQALDPTTAEDDTRWSLDVDSTPVDLSLQTLTYDHLAKTLRIDLVDDQLNGDSFDFGPAVGNEPRDVDGDLFASADFSGTVAGDAVLPSVSAAVQNRTADPQGETVDVLFSEDVEEVTAETPGNYTFTGGLSVVSATLLNDQSTVQILLDGLAVPGDVAVDVSGVVDLAGNAMAPVVAQGLTSTDTDAPTGSGQVVRALEGPDNDVVEVVFDEVMLDAEVVDVSNWRIESPIGVTVDDSLATFAYDPVTRKASVTFDGGDDIHFQTRDEFSIVLSGMRDISGNEVDATPLLGVVNAESTFPYVTSVWAETLALNKVHVRFSEPVAQLDDLYDETTNPEGQTVYVLFDGVGAEKGLPVSVTEDADGKGATVTFAVGAITGTDTLGIRGVVDLVGNQMFPVENSPIVAEDAVEPALNAGLSLALTVSGEENDVLTVEFDRDMSAWGIRDPANYDLDLGGTPVDLTDARFGFDGADTVTIDLDQSGADFLENGSVYTLTVDGLESAQGVTMSAASADSVTPAGDGAAPVAQAGRVRLDAADPANSLLLEMDEAFHPDDAGTPATFDILGVNPDTADVLGPRTVRLSWSGGVAAGQVVNGTVRDLAGNAGLVSQAVTGADTGGPVVTGVAGVITPGWGGDSVVLDFDFPMDFASVQNLGNYVITVDGQELDTLGAIVRYESGPAKVHINLPEGTELVEGAALNVVVSNVEGHGGVVMSPPADVDGTCSGDSDAPTLVSGYANYREDATGLVVDVLYSEDVTGDLVDNPSLYFCSGGQDVVDAVQIHDDMVRLTLDSPLLTGDEVEITGVEDVAGNVAGLIQVQPSL